MKLGVIFAEVSEKEIAHAYICSSRVKRKIIELDKGLKKPGCCVS